MRFALLTAGAGLLLMTALLGIAVIGGLQSTKEEPDRTRFRGNEAVSGLTMPGFALRDQNGRLVRSTDLRGRVVVLTFLDTKCTEACPIIAGQIANAWRLLTPSERGDAAAVAISTDPRHDTPANVRAFLARHRAENSVRYLIGPVPVMREVWRRFQILSSLDSGEAEIHSAPVRIYGPDLGWLATQHPRVDLSPRNLAHDIRVALGGASP